MFGVAAISVMRYCDMLSASEPDRTRSVTRPAYLDKCTAAWPAELPPPTHEDRLAGEGLGFRHPRPVEDPRSDQRLQCRHLQAPVGHASGDDDRPGVHLGAVAEGHHPAIPLCPQRRGGAAVDDVGPEQHRLFKGAGGQLGAADAPGEPEVVPDHGARTRLTAQRFAFHQGGPQPLGTRVDGGRQPRRSASHDDHVVGDGGRADSCPERLGHVPVARVDQHPSIEHDHDRQPLPARLRVRQCRSARLRLAGVEPVRHVVALQQVPDLVGTRRPLLTHDPDQLEGRPSQPPPLVEELGDAAVKSFVGRLDGLDQEVVGVPQSGRLCGRSAGDEALRRRDEQAAAGLRLDFMGPRQERRRWHLRHLLISENHGHLSPAAARS